MVSYNTCRNILWLGFNHVTLGGQLKKEIRLRNWVYYSLYTFTLCLAKMNEICKRFLVSPGHEVAKRAKLTSKCISINTA